jgi:predicted DNA-binding transcriptional regulator AlpA
MTTTFIRPKEAAKRSGFHIVTVRRKARDPNDPFPSLVDIGPCSQALVESEFEAWAERRIAERDGE